MRARSISPAPWKSWPIAVGRDTSFGKIVEAVEHAERSRAPIQKTADRYAGYLVYFALACAALTFAITRDARSTISVIIVAGACGIAAGTPLAVLGAIGRAARAGAIIKGGRYLEALWKVDTVAFDKTGTVTIGRPEILEIRPASGVTERAVLEAAAIAERRSEHPLADRDRAGGRRGRTAAGRTGDLRVHAGAGHRRSHERRARSWSAIARSWRATVSHPTCSRQRRAERRRPKCWSPAAARLLGAILIADRIRAEAPDAIRALRRLRIRTVLLTGDTLAVATGGRDTPCRSTTFRPSCCPTTRSRAVRRLAAGRHTVAMVGDGVNDAPALDARGGRRRDGLGDRCRPRKRRRGAAWQRPVEIRRDRADCQARAGRSSGSTSSARSRSMRSAWDWRRSVSSTRSSPRSFTSLRS